MLAKGLLVSFPTETVYGLGAAADNPEALQRLYAAKGRPTQHPVIVHLHSIDQLPLWAAEVPPAAMRLAEALWPGPLTLILKKAAHVSTAITGGQDTIGLRIPNHPVALDLLKKFNSGVAAPSANKFGRLSPTTAEDVAHEFADEVEIVLDGGPCEVGIESTIVDLSGATPRILRPGMILPEQIRAISGTTYGYGIEDATTPRVPGGLASHYAPRTPVELVESMQLMEKLTQLKSTGTAVCVLSFSAAVESGIPWAVAAKDPATYARTLYKNLRNLDRQNCALILVEQVPESDEWEGIADRLKRAACPSDGR